MIGNLPCMMVCGSRGICNDAAFRALRTAIRERAAKGRYILISGGAVGIDQHATAHARFHKIPTLDLFADWPAHGKRAGVLRNIELLDLADEVLAVWDGESPGTAHAIREARRRALPLRVLGPDGLAKGDKPC